MGVTATGFPRTFSLDETRSTSDGSYFTSLSHRVNDGYVRRYAMSTRDRDIDAMEPLVVRKTGEETGGEFVRFELTLYPQGSSPEGKNGLSHRRWSIDFPTEHVHPRQEERWRVLSGELGVAVDGNEDVLAKGETVALPPGVPHRIWNPIDEPSRVILEFHPALETQTLTETLYVLGQLGEVNEKGDLKVLQFAVIQAAHPDHLYLTAIPVRVQKILISLLAPIGRRAGYEATYSLDSRTRTDGGHPRHP